MSTYRLPFGVYVVRQHNNPYSSPVVGECGCTATKRPAPDALLSLTTDGIHIIAICPDCGKASDLGSYFRMTEKDADVLIEALSLKSGPRPATDPPSMN